MSATERRWIGFAVLLGCALRLTSLEVHSLWYDEAATIYEATHPDLFAVLRADRHPPLSFLIFDQWIRWFGESDFALRLLPALASCIALALFARVAIALLEGLPRLLAVLLYAVSPFHVWHGQEVRMYVFLELGALLAVLGFLLAVRENRFRLGLAATSAGLWFALGNHYFGALAALPLACILLREWKRRAIATKRALLVGGSLALPFLLWAAVFFALVPAQLRTGWAWQSKASVSDLLELPVRQVLVAGEALPAFWRPAGYATSALLLLGLVLGLVRAVRRPSSSERFAAALFAIPILATLASGLVGPLNLTPKYLMVASSGTVLLMATGLATLRVAPLRRALSFAAVLGCLSHTLMLKTANAREDYRYAAERVIESWRPGDLVLVVSGTYGGWSEAPVRHYLRARADILASVRDWSAIEPRSKSIWDATQRIHVIYREAGYSANAIAAVRKLGTMEREEPIRWRIQYLRLSN